MTTVATPAERRRAPGSPAQRNQAPGPLRRISGPISARAVAAATAASSRLAHPAPARTRESGGWPGPRRSSGPAHDTAAVPRPGRLGAFLRALPDHALLDRVVRGRAWIPILGVMLAGIVAMQVEMLKLGTTIGRSLQQTATLQTRNQLLRINVASLADDQRIERLAEAMGMVMPEPTAIGFLSARGVSAHEAAASIHIPEPSLFLSSLTSLEAAASGSLGPSGVGTGTGAAITATGASVQAGGIPAGSATPTAQVQTTQATQPAPPATQPQTAPTAQGSPAGQAAPTVQATTPAPAQATVPAAGTQTGTGQSTSGGAAAPSGG